MSKVIHWELRKKFKLDPTNKWYTYNLESVLEDEMHKVLWDFEIQTDHLISARRTVKKKKEKEKRERWVKLKESEKRDKYLELKKKQNDWTWKWRLYQL